VQVDRGKKVALESKRPVGNFLALAEIMTLGPHATEPRLRSLRNKTAHHETHTALYV
jgi:hypothetical protein